MLRFGCAPAACGFQSHNRAMPSSCAVRIWNEFSAGENTAEFTLEPDGAGTRVTWTMVGPKNVLMKVMGVFMNMDKMIGQAFEEGLGNLKALVEKGAS